MRALWTALLLALLAGSTLASAVGVAPAGYSLTFEPGLEKTFTLKVLNSEHTELVATVHAEGELAKYVRVNTPLLEFQSDEGEKILTFTIALPQALDTPGLHQADIVVVGIPKAAASQGAELGAQVAVTSTLQVMVPYAEKYAEARIIIPAFEKGRQSNFAVEVTNLGIQDLLDVQVSIDIYGPLNNRLKTLTSTSTSIAAKDKKLIIIQWVPDLENGNYNAAATVLYDKLTAKAERPFTIGTMQLDITSISVEDFKLGGIARFDIFVKNNYNLPINGVFAETTVKDAAGKAYTEFTTAAVNVEPYGTQRLQAYWDTEKVMPGQFVLDITARYLGTSTRKAFDIIVQQDRIVTSQAGAVTAEQADKPDLYVVVYVLAIGMIGLIAFNVYMYMKRRK